MKLFALISGVFGLLVVGCASAPPPPAASAETTSAVVPSREAWTPPEQFEMNVADRPEAEPVKADAPAHKLEADTTADKRKSGALMTLPGKSSDKAQTATPPSK